MSNTALTWAWSVPLPPPQKLVLLRLADTARDDGSDAWRSLALMQAETGLSRRAIQTAVRALLAKGQMIQTAAGDRARHLAPVYRLMVEAVPGAGDTPGRAQEVHPEPGAADAPGAVTTTSEVARGAPGSGTRCTRPGAGGAPPPNISQHISQQESANAHAHAHARETAEAMLAIFVEELGAVLPVPKKLTPERQKAAVARLKDSCGGDLEGWREACRQVQRSSFLTGGGPRGWRADWDWLLKPTNLMKISEGKYDDQPGAASARHHGGRIDRMNAVDQVFDAIRAGRGEER